MRGLPYYEEPEYHRYLLSPERKEIYPPEMVLSQIRWENVQNFLDFGMGNGYFLTHYSKYITPETHIWGAECQEVLIDYTLHLKVRDSIEHFTPFYIERTEHPLLPEWIPDMDMILCSCVLSTFADPALALRGIERSLRIGGSIIVVDWEKREAPSGPDMAQKISQDRMRFFVEDAGFKIIRNLKLNQYFYGMEIVRGENFDQNSGLPRYADF